MSFPTDIPVRPTWGGNDKLADVDHAGRHNDDGDDIPALATKLGTGSSTPTTGKVLTGTGTGSSAWEDPADARLQSSTTPSPVGTAAVGTGTTDARADHVHAASGDTPSTQAFGDAAAAGSSAKAAQSDHKHAMPSFATPAISLGAAAAAGSATTPIRSDATIAAFDATAPSTQAFGDPAAVGTAAVAARRDHKHAMPSERAASSSTPAAVGTAAVGTGTTDARADHVHATGAGTPSTQALGDAAATGSGPAAAMTDHKHAMPSATATASGLTVSATDKVLGRSTAGSGAVEEITLTSAGRALIDDASAAVMRATLGLTTGNAFREAVEMWPSTTSGCSALSTTEMATNKQNIRALSFADAATQYAETAVVLDGWDGGTFTVTIYSLWNSAFFNTRWQVEARSYGHQEAADQAWGTAVAVTVQQAGAAAYAICQGTTAAVTPSGTPAVNELVQLRIARLGADGADDLSIAALLYGIRINYTKS